MRINGFNQIKAFYSWCFENQDKVKPHHVSLYMFLLNQNNRSNWIEWFKVPMDVGMAGSCISSKKTYYQCLNDLQSFSLLKYKKGANNWKAPQIKIEVLKDTSTVPQVDTQVVLLPIPLQHLFNNNLKLITDNKEFIEKNFVSWVMTNINNPKEEEHSSRPKLDINGYPIYK
jgi:hypothetical protein